MIGNNLDGKFLTGDTAVDYPFAHINNNQQEE